MRTEFSKAVKRDAFFRANGKCEGVSCGAFLSVGKFHYDHEIPDQLGGEATLENCKVLCFACHKVKTTKHDVPNIAKAKRRELNHLGIKSTSSRPMPGTKASGIKKYMDGRIARR